jgi:hypothetical protein
VDFRLKVEGEFACGQMRVAIPCQKQHLEKSMQVVQTAGVPPNQGSISLPSRGCSRKRRSELTKRVEP